MDTQLPQDHDAEPYEDNAVVDPASFAVKPEKSSIAPNLVLFIAIPMFLVVGLFLGFCIDFCLALWGEPRSLHLFCDILGWL